MVMIGQAPALHGALTLAERCEISLCGFLLQDLWSILSSRRESKCGLKKGSCQMAPQTRVALQNVSLTIAAMTKTKPDTWTPFGCPHSLSEVHIERLFGQYRSYSSSGDLNARSFWSSAAAQARQQLFKMKTRKRDRNDIEKIPALDDQQPLAC